MTCGSSKFVRTVAAAILTLVMLSTSLLVSSGCGDASESKQKQYKSAWTEIMNEFEAKVTKGDRKAQEMIAKGDTAGVMKLLEERIADVWDVYDDIVVLYPPNDLRKLHALSLYYLISVNEQLDAQNALNEAMISGKPTDDLKAIAEQAVQKTQGVIAELALELEKQGIKLDSMKDNRPNIQEEQGTVPSSGQ